MIKRIYFIVFFLIFQTFSAYGEQRKLQVCSVTINSSQEIETFRERLDPEKFEFIELVPQESEQEQEPSGPIEITLAGEEPSWFERACERDIQCDVLVISGHFGGSFFGTESDYYLSLQEMEKLVCQRKCEGVLSHVKEVFLFGCNTLAGKAPDNRTPEEYLQVLLEDHIPRPIAERVTATRYSHLNNSFQNKMRLVFTSPDRSALLYGFHSIGPAGSSVKHLLEDYFKRIKETKGGYYEHLSEIDRELFPNKSWSEALRITYQTQALSFTSHDKEYETHQKVCGFYTNPDDVANMRLAEELLRSGEGSSWLSYISDFIDEGEFEGEALELFQDLREDEGLSREFSGLYREFVADFGTDLAIYMYSYLRFLKVMSWIDEREYREELGSVVRHLVLEGSLESYDTLRSIDYETRDFSGVIHVNRDNEPIRELFMITERNISFEELPEDYFSREGALPIMEMGFIKLNDKRIQENIIEMLENESLSSSLQRTAFSILRKSEPSDLDILKWLVNKLDPSVIIGGAFSVLLYGSDLSHPETQKFIAEKLEDENPLIQEQALVLLKVSKTSEREIHKKIAKKLKSKNSSVERIALGALREATGPLDPEVLKSIATKLEHEETAIQILALVALGEHLGDSIDPEIKKQIESKLGDENPPVVQITALLVLERISPSDPEISQLITTKLEDETLYAMAETIALSIYGRIIIYGPITEKGKIKRIRPQEKILDIDTTEALAQFIFKGVDYFSDSESIKLIAEKLEDPNPIVQVITLFLLAEIIFDDLKIQKQIEKKQEDKNPMVRKAAKEALRRISLPVPDSNETTHEYERPLRVNIRIEVGERPESESLRAEAEIIEPSEAPQVEINREAFNFEPDQMEIENIETPEPEQIERSN